MTISDATPIITALAGLLASPVLIQAGKRWLGFRGSEIEYLRSSIDRLEGRVQALEQERLNLIERLSHKDMDIARLEERVRLLADELETMGAVNAELEKEVKRLREAVASHS